MRKEINFSGVLLVHRQGPRTVATSKGVVTTWDGVELDKSQKWHLVQYGRGRELVPVNQFGEGMVDGKLVQVVKNEPAPVAPAAAPAASQDALLAATKALDLSICALADELQTSRTEAAKEGLALRAMMLKTFTDLQKEIHLTADGNKAIADGFDRAIQQLAKTISESQTRHQQQVSAILGSLKGTAFGGPATVADLSRKLSGRG